MAGHMKKSGGARKIGRNRDKCKRYESEGRREKNKLRRITKCQGPAAAEAWKREHMVASRGHARLVK